MLWVSTYISKIIINCQSNPTEMKTRSRKRYKHIRNRSISHNTAELQQLDLLLQVDLKLVSSCCSTLFLRTYLVLTEFLTSFFACSTFHSRWRKHHRNHASVHGFPWSVSVGLDDISAFSFSICSSGSPIGPHIVGRAAEEWPKYFYLLEERNKKVDVKFEKGNF